MTFHGRSEDVLSINVGPLNGLGSLCLHVAPQLQQYNRSLRKGLCPEVEWDLRQVSAGEMNMASLTAFLAVAERMRRFSGHATTARVDFKPRVFAFWKDIHFLQIARELDLLRWTPENIVGGFGELVGMTNPNTMILSFPEASDAPSWDESNEWQNWKDSNRQQLTNELLARCGAIFDPPGNSRGTVSSMVEPISRTVAELALNARYWGKSAAFVGLQRSTAGISVAVCDVGQGFLSTINEQVERKGLAQPKTHLEALLLGCFLNQKDFGLRPAIDRIVKKGGWVTVSSFDTEIRWSGELWGRAVLLTEDPISDPAQLAQRLGGKVTQTPSSQTERSKGYWRTYPEGLRGVRIAFELPLPRQPWRSSRFP